MDLKPHGMKLQSNESNAILFQSAFQTHQPGISSHQKLARSRLPPNLFSLTPSLSMPSLHASNGVPLLISNSSLQRAPSDISDSIKVPANSQRLMKLRDRPKILQAGSPPHASKISPFCSTNYTLSPSWMTTPRTSSTSSTSSSCQQHSATSPVRLPHQRPSSLATSSTGQFDSSSTLGLSIEDLQQTPQFELSSIESMIQNVIPRNENSYSTELSHEHSIPPLHHSSPLQNEFVSASPTGKIEVSPPETISPSSPSSSKLEVVTSTSSLRPMYSSSVLHLNSNTQSVLAAGIEIGGDLMAELIELRSQLNACQNELSVQIERTSAAEFQLQEASHSFKVQQDIYETNASTLADQALEACNLADSLQQQLDECRHQLQQSQKDKCCLENQVLIMKSNNLTTTQHLSRIKSVLEQFQSSHEQESSNFLQRVLSVQERFSNQLRSVESKFELARTAISEKQLIFIEETAKMANRCSELEELLQQGEEFHSEKMAELENQLMAWKLHHPKESQPKSPLSSLSDTENDELSKLKAELINAQHRIKSLNYTIRDNELILASRQAELQTSAEEASAATFRNHDLSSKLAEAERLLIKQQAILESMEIDIDAKNVEILQLKSNLHSIQKLCSQLTENAAAQAAESQQFLIARDHLSKELSELRAQFHASQVALDELKSELQRVTEYQQFEAVAAPSNSFSPPSLDLSLLHNAKSNQSTPMSSSRSMNSSRSAHSARSRIWRRSLTIQDDVDVLYHATRNYLHQHAEDIVDPLFELCVVQSPQASTQRRISRHRVAVSLLAFSLIFSTLFEISNAKLSSIE